MSLSALYIPTYQNHFDLNVAFLKSVISNNDDIGSLPSIFFGVSTKKEKNVLTNIIKNNFPNILSKVVVFDMEELFILFNECVSGDNYDPDLTLFYLDGKCSLINLKKISGVNEIFKRGYESVVVLDSETIQFKRYKLSQFVDDISKSTKFRFSYSAYQHELITKIQHDSIRTVVPTYNTSHIFSRSYGWFDNVCVYHRNTFNSFVDYMSDGFDGAREYERMMFVASKFKGFSFEWLAYKAYQLFVLDCPQELEDIDSIILRYTGKKAWSTPQTENIYQYLTGDEEKDSALLMAVNPPWIPYTENEYTRKLINKYLPSSCCLMFHLDRKHPGSEAETKSEEEIPAPEMVIESPPIVSFPRRAINKLVRIIKNSIV